MHEIRTFVFDPHAGHASPGDAVFGIRVALLEGEPWWYASDVCTVLGVQNPTDALLRLDDDEKGTLGSTEGGPGRRIINEAGLYTLVLGSRKPEAKTFRRWITHEVLPAIRKTGGYQMPAFDIPKTFHGALALAAKLEQERASLACKVAQQADDLEALEPKAAFADRVASAQGLHSIAAAAKIFGTGQNRFFNWLRVHEFLILGTCTPFQRFIDQGLFVVRERVFTDQDGHDHIKARTFISGKGMIAIQKRMEAEREGALIRPQHMAEVEL